MPDTLSVGSSGALCGLIGAWVPFILTTWNQTLPRDIKMRNAQLMVVVFSIVIMVPLSFVPMVDWAAHIGGTLFGFCISAAVFANRIQTQNWRIATRVAGIVSSVALLAVSVVWVFFFTKPNKELLNLCPPPGCWVMVNRTAEGSA